jgi:putative transposase
MKKSKFSSRLRLLFSKPKAERRLPRCAARLGISEATFYRWKQLYGGLMPSRQADQ